MTEEEFGALHPASQTGDDDSENKNLDQQGDEDVFSESSTDVDDFGDDFGDDQGDNYDLGNNDAQGKDLDDRGVPWKNKAMELERKLAALQKTEDNQFRQIDINSSPAPKLPFSNFQQPVPPPPPQPPLSQPVLPQEAQDPQQVTTLEELLKVTKQQAIQEAQQVYQQQLLEYNRQTRIQEAYTNIMKEYPDVANSSTPLSQLATQVLASRYGNDPVYSEEAVMMASNQLGIQPKSRQVQAQGKNQRQLPKNNPPLPSSEKGNNVTTPRQPKLPAMTINIAKRWGIPLKGVQQMVKSRSYELETGNPLFDTGE